MADRLLLDTHVWLWLISEHAALDQTSRAVILRAQMEVRVFVSSFFAWEVALKEASGKLAMAGGVDGLLRASFEDGALQVADLTVPVLVAANHLPAFNHGDPADRIIVATAREGGYTLLTHDDRILRYSAAGHVAALRV